MHRYLRAGTIATAALGLCVLIGLWVGKAIDQALTIPR